jgi:cytochrome c oxidase assembly protein subunit 15
VVFIVHLLIVYLILRKPIKIKFLKNLLVVISFLVLFEILSGVGMAYFSIPEFLQPVHLFFAFLIFGLQFYLLLIFRANNFKRS